MDKIYIVMDYVEHDLKALMETMTQPFLVGKICQTIKIIIFLIYPCFSLIYVDSSDVSFLTSSKRRA